MSTRVKEKWYYRTWFIILMLIVFSPIGLILMWAGQKWSSTVRIIVTLVFAGLWLLYLLPYLR